ncbi:hypothetical protein BH09PLA1_BH09PLA1_25680 [soil metagenome]
MAGLLVAEGKEVAAKTEFNRIAKRRAADDFDARTVAEAHLKQTPFDFRIAADGNDAAATPDTQLAEKAGLECLIICAGERFWIGGHQLLLAEQQYNSLRLSFNCDIDFRQP